MRVLWGVWIKIDEKDKYLDELEDILFQVKASDKLSQCRKYSATSLLGSDINVDKIRNNLHI